MNSNKVILVTGGSAGIGKALALEFGRHGYNAFITARKEDRLLSTVEELTNQGIEAGYFAGDISKLEDAKAMVEACLGQFGRLDILVNNAGISMRSLFEETDVEVIKRVMDINFYGMLYITKFALPYIKQNQGGIISISSIAGHRGLPGRTGYSASKFAMNGFMEALRTELIHDKIHLLTVSPGFVATDIRKTALTKDGAAQKESPRNESKMMTPEEVSKSVYAAYRKKKKTLVLSTLGKTTVFMNKWFNGFLDKRIYQNLAKEADSPLNKG